MAIIKLAEMDFLRDGWIKWKCDKSPDGCCQYDDKKDPAWDDCIHCHEPYERK